VTATAERSDLRAAREIVARLNDPETGGRYERWVERARGCEHPVRLRGASREADASTGEVVGEFASEGEPDGVLLTPCGNRRAHVCPSCSEVYRGDAWQLVAAGLRGGKGVPNTVSGHPLVFATFTAPSFGPVHTTRESVTGSRLACRPRSRGETCPHGRSLACRRRHREDDACLGEAICPDCFDAQRAALWNHNTGRLFKRTRTYVEREIARQAGLTQARARGLVRVSYSKVAEFQRRGVVHFHLVWRLDGVGEDGELVAPPQRFDAQLLVDAITAALPTSTVPAEDTDADPYGWGSQHDVRALDLRGDLREASRVAGYIAKYATKSTEDAGGVRYRISTRTSSSTCHAVSTPSGWSPAPGTPATRSTSTASVSAAGRISSASAGTASPRAAASPRPSKRCAKRAPSTPPSARPPRARRPRKVTTTCATSPRGATPAAATARPATRFWLLRATRERASTDDWRGRRRSSCGAGWTTSVGRQREPAPGPRPRQGSAHP
jgi:hypothetical protein